MGKIQDNQWIRLLCKPYMDFRRKKTQERYLRSPDSWYLKTLKGIHAGKRCFIIGNGPSLCAEDLDKLKGEFTFAVNRIYEIFNQTDWRPSFYVAVDQNFLKENYARLQEYSMGHMFLNVGEKARLDYPIHRMTRILTSGDYYFDIYQKRYNMWNTCVSIDVSQFVCTAGTVVFAAIQLALYMGFSEVYLLGIDFNYSVVRDADGRIYKDKSVKDYFDNKNYQAELNYETVLHVFRMSKEYCDEHGVIIQNATRGGKLEVFERVDFDNLL